MPYRRLPNTDQARVRTLRTALEESDRQHLQLVISYQTQHEAKILLQKFDQAIGLYKQTYENQVNSNKDFQQIFRNARLYISHFIQVLNLAVQRNEIKKEYKKLYHLDPEDFSVPDMVSSESLIEWGQSIIEGEALRMKAGGVPLYNPAIAKVKVHYDIFKEYRDNQLFLQQNTARYGDKVNDLRQPVDDLILEIWNQIEGFFSELPPYKRMESCKQFGVIYYYRRGEAELTPADDLPKPIEVVETLPAVESVAVVVAPEVIPESVEVEPESVVVEEIAPIEIPVATEQVVEEESVLEPIEAVVEEVRSFEPEQTPIVAEKEEDSGVVMDADQIAASIDVPVEIILETVVDELVDIDVKEIAPAFQQDDNVEATLFDDVEVAADTSEEIPELKLNGAIPKKRKKRNTKQDALLSLFFQ